MSPAWSQLTFQQVSYERKVEVRVEVEAHEVVHLLALPLQRFPDLHEDLLRALQREQAEEGEEEEEERHTSSEQQSREGGFTNRAVFLWADGDVFV